MIIKGMKKIHIGLVVATAVISAFGIFSISEVVAQESSSPISAQQEQEIRQECSMRLEVLSRLRASDGVLRVNRGQLYESISTRLMARLNSRIAANSLDGGNLFETAANYERSLDQFRQRYIAYEETISDAMRIDCVKNPAEFNDMVNEARRLRRLVHDEVLNLHRYIKEYNEAFDEFSSSFRESPSE